MNNNPEYMTLAERAEVWWIAQGKKVPKDATKWIAMYEKWVDYAFKEIEKNNRQEK